jgi:hypothetical protein
MNPSDYLVRARIDGEIKKIPFSQLPPNMQPCRIMDEYGNIEPEELWLAPGETRPATKMVHPPFTDPRAKQLMRDLYETFREVAARVGDAKKSSPETWEENFRYDYTVSYEVALWLKARWMFTQLIKGHWNDAEWCLNTYQLIYDWLRRREGLLQNVRTERDAKAMSRFLDLWFRSLTVEEFREQVAPWLPPDIELSVQGIRERLGETFELPENPDLERFLRSVVITLPDMTLDRLRQLATQNYPSTGVRLPAAFIHLLCVNYARHELTTYDREFDRFLGKQPVAVQTLFHAALKTKVLDAIASKWPALEKECLRQRSELPEVPRNEVRSKETCSLAASSIDLVEDGLDEDKIRRFVQLMESGTKFSYPVLNLEADGRYTIVDGFYCIAASLRLGAKEIPAYVVRCDDPKVLADLREYLNSHNRMPEET